MGRDKALLSLDGQSFVEAIAAAAAPLAASITVVGRTESVHTLASVPDLRPGRGPLAGIETALTHAHTTEALVIACDLPLVTTEFLAHLIAVSRATPGAIVVPHDQHDRLSYLCGVYPTHTRPIVAALLDADEPRPRALLSRVPTIEVGFQDYSHLPGAASFLTNINTPDDYDMVRALHEVKDGSK